MQQSEAQTCNLQRTQCNKPATKRSANLQRAQRQTRTTSSVPSKPSSHLPSDTLLLEVVLNNEITNQRSR